MKEVSLVGLSGAGHWAAAARAVAGDHIEKAAISAGGFRFANLESDWDADFLPGAVKYRDVDGFVSLAARHSLWLDGETDETVFDYLKK